MSAGQAIYGKLTTTDAVSDLIGERVYPAKAVQFGARPLVAYDVTQSDYDRHYGGASGLSSHTVTISCVGDDYDAAELLAEVVRAAIDNGGGTWGTQAVRGCFVQNVGDSTEFEIETDVVLWQKDIEVQIWLAAS